MPEIEIHAKKLMQPMSCKCGHSITPGCIAVRGDSIEIICSACHSSLLEIQIDLPEDSEWD